MSLISQGLNWLGSGLDASFGTDGLGILDTSNAPFQNFLAGDVGGFIDGTRDFFAENNLTGIVSGGGAYGSSILGGGGGRGGGSSTTDGRVPREIINTGQARQAVSDLGAAGKMRGTPSVDPKAAWAEWQARMRTVAGN
jgi:hypothetical protein